MTFDSYLNQAWQDHAVDSEKVAASFDGALISVETGDQLFRFIGLVTHVMGEHLGLWDEGHALLRRLRAHPECRPNSEADKAALRSMAVMIIGAGKADSLSGFDNSDRIRILSVAASALAQRDAVRVKSIFDKCLAFAEEDLSPSDPATRALAIAGNNLACALEEKSDRSPAETELMILAAQTGRRFWELAGTWLEISRAEYRLAMSFLTAGETESALRHADNCRKICEENNASSLDRFFAYEALAQVARARASVSDFHYAARKAKDYFEMLPAEDQRWCEKSLKAFSL